MNKNSLIIITACVFVAGGVGLAHTCNYRGCIHAAIWVSVNLAVIGLVWGLVWLEKRLDCREDCREAKRQEILRQTYRAAESLDELLGKGLLSEEEIKSRMAERNYLHFDKFPSSEGVKFALALMMVPGEGKSWCSAEPFTGFFVHKYLLDLGNEVKIPGVFRRGCTCGMHLGDPSPTPANKECEDEKMLH